MKAWNALRPVLALFLQSSHRKQLLSGVLLAIATVLAGMALLGLSGWFLTACYVAGLSTATALMFDVFAPGAGVRLLSVLRTAARYGERVTTHDATLRVLAELRVQLFSRFAANDIALALRQRPARLLYRLTSDIDALDAVYLRLLTPAAALLASALVTGLALGLFLDWRSGALVACIIVAGGVACIAWCMRRGFVSAIRRSVAGEHLRAAVIDAVGGQTELVMAGSYARQINKVTSAEHQLYAADMALNRTEAIAGITIAMVGHVATAAALLCGAWLAHQGQIGAPIMALATLLLLAALEPLLNIRRGAMEAGRTLLAARRLGPQLKNSAAEPTVLAPRAGVAVDIINASAQHPQALQPVLSSIKLCINDAEWVVLAGASGAGKSSLLALIAGDLPYSAGQVARQSCASLPQRTELFHDTIAGNLRLAKPDAADEELWAALATAGLAEHVQALPQRLSTMLGSQGAGLSGGESRRLAVARLLLHPAPLALLDEPTEGLDRTTAAQVMQSLAQWQGARCAKGLGAIVMASHLQREARFADRIVWLEGGRIAAQAQRGTPAFDDLLQRLRPG
ncbi:MAG: ATP-binding cassette domain-containing protein [Comamonas sp.]